MSGLMAAHWSGYAGEFRVFANVTGIGELVLTRSGDNLSKSYAYPVAKSGDEILLRPEFKRFDKHHAPLSNPAPVETFFGKFQSPVPSGGCN
jgi:hypothetical protein